MAARTGMANLITRLRTMVNDDWQLRQDTATGDGTTALFWLNHKPNKSGGTVYVGGTAQGTASYTWDNTFGRLSFTSAPANGGTIAVEYQSCQFTDDQLEDILDSNAVQIEGRLLKWLPDTIGGGTIDYHRAAIGWRDLEESSSGTARWTIRDSVGALQAESLYSVNYMDGIVNFTVGQAGTAYYLTARSYDLHGAAADVWLRRMAQYSEWYQYESEGQRMSRQQAYDHAEKQEKATRQRAGQNRQRGAMQSGTFVRTDLRSS